MDKMKQHALAGIVQVCRLYTLPLEVCWPLSGVFKFFVQGDLAFSVQEAVSYRD